MITFWGILISIGIGITIMSVLFSYFILGKLQSRVEDLESKFNFHMESYHK